MGKEEVGRENTAMEGHCWEEARPEAQDSSTPYPRLRLLHFSVPSCYLLPCLLLIPQE